MPEETISVRYMVNDVPSAVDFYTKHFGFTVGANVSPAFADVFRGNLLDGFFNKPSKKLNSSAADIE